MLRKLIHDTPDKIKAFGGGGSPKFTQFVLVGTLDTVFGYLVFAGLYLLNGEYSLAIVLATIAGTVFNFLSPGQLVFAYRGLSLFPLFGLGDSAVCLTNILLVGALARVGRPQSAGKSARVVARRRASGLLAE